jgi:hypothetical protein
LTNENIKPAVAVHIRHADTGRPPVFTGYPGLPGNIFKLPISFVQVKPVADEVPAEIYIGQTVVVDVTDTNPGAIKKIMIQIRVSLPGKFNLIQKINTSFLIIDQAEYSGLVRMARFLLIVTRKESGNNDTGANNPNKTLQT